MKTRLISAAVGLVILFACLFLYQTFIFNIACAAVLSIAIYEFLHVFEFNQYYGLSIILILISQINLLFFNSLSNSIRLLLVFIQFLVVIAYQFFYFEKLKLTDLTLVLFFSIFLTSSFSVIFYIRSLVDYRVSISYFIFSLTSAWLSDTGAYLIGKKFGKNRLCPKISPNKTTEGLFGGILFGTCGNIICAYILTEIFELHFLYSKVILASLILIPIGVIGDLTASTIKRQHGIKDFGNIMPGHGGVMDRFDSVVLILPALYFIYLYLPFIIGD